MWTEPTETTIAQTPGSEEPECGIATPPLSLAGRWWLIKLLSRIVPELAEANADCANARRGARGPAASARVRMQAVGSPGVAS